MGKGFWTPEHGVAQRRKRFVLDQGRYIKECQDSKAVRDGVRGGMAAVIYSKMDPAPNLLGSFTYPAEFGSDDRRRWYLREFLREWWSRGSYAIGYERHKSGLLHAHALGHELGLRRLSMHDAWNRRTGGFAKVEAVRSPEHATLYIAKYICKEEQGELELGPGIGGEPVPAPPPWELEVGRGFRNPWRPRGPGKGG